MAAQTFPAPRSRAPGRGRGRSTRRPGALLLLLLGAVVTAGTAELSADQPANFSRR